MAEWKLPGIPYTVLFWWPLSRPHFYRYETSWLLQFGPFGLRRLCHPPVSGKEGE